MRTFANANRCTDIASLKSMVTGMSTRFGVLKRLDILTAVHEGHHQAICFLRLKTPEQEQALMKSLGVGRFGGELVFVVDLKAPPAYEDSAPSSQWMDDEAL